MVPPSMLRPVALLVTVAALAVAGCGKDASKNSGAKGGRTATGAAAGTTSAGCQKVPQPRPKGAQHLSRPTDELDPKRTYIVQMRTNCGEIDIRLDVRRAPKTTASVASLVRKGFYDGLSFHRVVPDFVIQGGDPLGNGQGGPGYTVVEKPPATLRYRRGVVAMAKTEVEDPGTSGSQLYVVTAIDAGLPPIYALVGRVEGSMSAIDRIAATPTNAESRPIDPVVIQKATLLEQ